MNIGFQLATLCLAFLLVGGSLTLPDPTGWEPAPPPGPEATHRPPPTGPPPFNPRANLSDISDSDWFYRSVRIGVQYGFVRGSAGRFEPERAITRSELITMLGRITGYESHGGGRVRAQSQPHPRLLLLPGKERVTSLAMT